ncbi:MAG: hypothetical protein HYY93_09970 [Planctomycetes bacterium]|nr:hypothetical protein [Planctomycetota bacterium]
MIIPARSHYTWEHARERIDRMAEANRVATEEWLRSLTPEESISIFEDLSRGLPENDRTLEREDHPVPLHKIWKF